MAGQAGGKLHLSDTRTVKVSVDGHDSPRNVKAVSFSLSLVCEPVSQSSSNMVPVFSVPDSESYEPVSEARAWRMIDRELVPGVHVGERRVRAEYFLCAT